MGEIDTPYYAGGNDLDYIDCSRCGKYKIDGGSGRLLRDDDSNGRFTNIEQAGIGHWLRNRQRFDDKPYISWEKIRELAENPRFPSLTDQREALLRILAESSEAPGVRLKVNFAEEQYAIGAKRPEAVKALLNHLESEELVKIDKTTPDCYSASLTYKGWLEFEELERGHTSGRKAFYATPFGKQDLEEKWEPGLKDAVKETGFDLLRVDDEPKPGLIDVRMRMQIKEARFLIVELTHANLGAYWEAGYAEGLGKPVIYTFMEERDKERPHFDVDHSLRVNWQPDNLDDAFEQVKAIIRNAFPDARPEPENQAHAG